MIPVYTSMETMNVPVHKVTDDDLKGITFQVIPQLYWKYEWSYNDYMIHRVGKLNPTNLTYNLYDMLGNVWELTRDKWSETVSACNGKVNPIMADISSTGRVIRGGAFD